MSNTQLVLRTKKTGSKPSKALVVQAQKKSKNYKAQEESMWQRTLRLGAKATYSAYTGNIPAALDVAYEALGSLPSLSSSSAPTATSLAAPVSGATNLSGSFTSNHNIVPTGRRAEDTMRIRGQILIGTLVSGVSSYYIDTGTSTYALSDTEGDFVICMQGSNLIGSAAYTGSPRVFNPPTTFLADLGKAYTFWRPNACTLKYVPICPTSTGGSVSMAWRPNDTTYTVKSNLIYGSAPFNVATLSQYACFTTGPAWAPSGFTWNPRKKGICENANDWLTVDDILWTSNGGGQTSNADVTKFVNGYATFHLTGFATTATPVQVGYVIYEFDYTFHMHSPNKLYSGIYGLTRDGFDQYLKELQMKYDRAQREAKERSERKKERLVWNSPGNTDPDRPLTPDEPDTILVGSSFSPTAMRGRGGGKSVTTAR